MSHRAAASPGCRTPGLGSWGGEGVMLHSPSAARGSKEEGAAEGAGKGQSLEVFN